MTEALTDKGFEVEAAPDAGHALRYLLSGADVDILFTDIDLGEGMDGATLAQIAREMRPSLPIVYASGRRSMEQIRDRAELDVPAEALFAQSGRPDDRAAGAQQRADLASPIRASATTRSIGARC